MAVLVSPIKYLAIMRPYVKNFGLLLLLLLSLNAYAQSNKKEKLEELKVRLMDEIDLANRILEETQKDKKASIGSIETVQRKIKLREDLIKTLDKEIEQMADREEALKRERDTLKVNLERQKEAYAKMIQEAYKSRSTTSRLMFILSAKDFNQALLRQEYLKQYSAFRKRKVQEIESSQKAINQKAIELHAQKVRKEALRNQLNVEQKRLTDERLTQQEAINEYKNVEKDLVAKLKAKQTEARKVEKDIQRIIAKEIKRAKAAAERNQIEVEAMSLGLERGRDFTSNTSEERLKSLIADKRKALAAANVKVDEPAPAKSYALTPAATQLSANFAANQKRLPWPVARGLVVTKFGTQRHPVVPSVIIENNGIDIATEKGSAVTAIFEGEVSSVITMPDGYRAIIVNHGKYFSVYQNVTSVKVVQGQKLTKGDAIGTVATNPNNNESRLHLEVWSNNKPVDPLGWLAAK
jgi:septal ring factor EnvC (AmiA/AmiB activator)